MQMERSLVPRGRWQSASEDLPVPGDIRGFADGPAALCSPHRGERGVMAPSLVWKANAELTQNNGKATLGKYQNACPPRRPLNFQNSQMIPATNANTIKATQLFDSVATDGW